MKAHLSFIFVLICFSITQFQADLDLISKIQNRNLTTIEITDLAKDDFDFDIETWDEPFDIVTEVELAINKHKLRQNSENDLVIKVFSSFSDQARAPPAFS